MRQQIAFTLIITFLALSLNGQIRYFDERYVSTMMQLTPVLVNPGATGFENTHQFIANYRNKWATHPGTPKTYMVSYDGPIADNLSFGAQFLNDTNGALRTSKVQGTFAYMLRTAVNKLNVGLSGEYIQHGLDAALLTDASVEGGDNEIISRVDGTSFFDVSVGVYGVFDEKVTYGLVLPSLVNTRLGNDLVTDVDSREFGLIANIGYKYAIDGVDASIEPSIYFKRVNNVPTHADINILGRFADDKFRGGYTYSVGADNRVGFLVGVTFNALELHYGYNLSRNDIQTFNNGSHEISLRFDIGGAREYGKDPGGLIEMKEGIETGVRKTIERQ